MPEGTIDLRTGRTVWQAKHGPPQGHDPLLHDARCEIVVIGGGVTGALIAWELVNAGVDCIVIDQSRAGGGSTFASTALLSYELDTPLRVLAGHLGERNAAACYRACLDTIDQIGTIVADLKVDCGFRQRSSYYLLEDRRELDGLQEEYRLRRKHGMAVEFLRQEEIEERFSFTRPGALLTRDAAEIDIVAFVGALVEQAIARGVRVYGETPMQSYRETVDGVKIATRQGCEISARKAVFATGYESERYLGETVGKLKSTYAIATKPIADFQGWHDRSLIWTSGDPYLYLRTTVDDRAVIGGGDVNFHDGPSRDALIPAKAQDLENSLRTMFPDIELEVDCAWAGTFGETADSLAYIGCPAARPGAFFALGYGGNGIAYSAIAASIVCDGYFGKSNPVAGLFRFDR